MKQPLIFCDFDGTITARDNIVAIMKHFAPEESAPIIRQILNQEISIRKGVGKLFGLLPSALKEEITYFALQQAEIREGFQRFLDYIKREEISFRVVSGGIDFFVDPILEPFGLKTNQVFRNESDFSGEYIQITWPHPCDDNCQGDCGLCKTSLFRRYANEKHFKIMIGDSITDLAASKQADLVFARGFLLEKCLELGLPHHPYESFDDIVRVLKTKPWAYAERQAELTEIKQLFAARDWFPGTSGNLSVRTADDPLQFLVTASGKDKTKTTHEDYLLVDQQSQPCYPTQLKPSAETTIHEAIYKAVDAGAVLHVHTVYNNLISDYFLEDGFVEIANIELIKALNIWDEGAVIQVPIVTNYADIPTLTEEVKGVLDPRIPAVLIHNHGIYAWGKSLFEAKKHLEAFEFMFEFVYKRLLLQSLK